MNAIVDHSTLDAIFPVSLQGGIETVNARDLHRFLEVGKDYTTWIKDRISAYGFQEGYDFVIFEELNFPSFGENSRRGRGRPSKEYALSLDMAKEISMVERNEKGRMARQYFIDCEKRLREKAHLQKALNDVPTLQNLLLDNVTKRLEAEAEVKKLKPKAAGYDRLLNSDGLILPIELGKAIGEQPKLTIEWLRRHGYIYGKGKILPYAKYDSTPGGKGYFKVVVTEEGYVQTYVTPKGLDHFSKKLARESVLA
jgi:anti-repressor protein